MTLKKGRRDFRERVLSWAKEGGAVKRCPQHPELNIHVPKKIDAGRAVIQEAWQNGHISSDVSGALDLFDDIIGNLPAECPACDNLEN
ncbi:MAG: hypothetical protein HKN36_02160 [Hellea sp.]|nr:hypothetical protein [Hellea sp.]